MSILAGLDAIFDQHLRVEDIGASSPHYKHRRSAIRLSTGRPSGFDARQLLVDAYAQLVSNLARSPRFARSGPSQENWRFEKQVRDDPQNPSPEVTLERAIARATGPDWANQVPTGSGLWDHRADKRCAVDLVRRVSQGSFELIELKVESDTPVGAAVEIVQYGLLFILAREHYPESDRRSKELLQARELRLTVLAPVAYYARYALGWLEAELDAGLRSFSADRRGDPLLASFRFEAFPDDFQWPVASTDAFDCLCRRRRVWSADPVDVNPSVPKPLPSPTGNPAIPGTDSFAGTLRQHMSRWAMANGLSDHVESARRRPWVLATEHRGRNVFHEQWWRHIEGYEHLWARALNSSQCFAVNLFAPLAEDSSAANRFLQRMMPDRAIAAADHVGVVFEHSPSGVAERLGERQPTQIDVFFTVVREGQVLGAIGVEVKLSEPEFGSCRGWTGVRGGAPVNPARERCMAGPRLFQEPERQCFMSEHEGRKYWSLMTSERTSFAVDSLAAQDHCPFRYGLYQMMRNRVALDAWRSITNADWSDFAVCVHPSNSDVFRLPEPVAGETNAIEAFRTLLQPGGVLNWDAHTVLDTMVDLDPTSTEWAGWMRSKYLLA